MTHDFEALVREWAGESAARRRIPRATYRMQFHKDFTFRDAEALVPYLDALGISDLYTSPILKAVPGSTHGYDICDPRQLNPELGTPEDFARLCKALKAHAMGLTMDIVPNHMGIGNDCNEWWLDVLENGHGSAYASYFDIDWTPVKPELKDHVLLPILEDQYGNVLESGKLSLSYADGAFHLNYADRQLPVAPGSYRMILDTPAASLAAELGEADAQAQELQSILTALDHLPRRSETKPAKLAERQREKEIIKKRIAALYDASAEFRGALDETLVRLNGTTDDPHSFDRLDELINAQAYRLAYWRVAAEEINYRRFFDVNTMAAIHTELPEVFDATHGLVFELLAKGQVTGLRIDHPDGLWNPAAYFRKLQEEYVKRMMIAGMDEPPDADETEELEQAIRAWFDEQYDAEGKFNWAVYTVAEKILSETEPLPREWAVAGTTGYDFMNLVNSLFVNNHDEAELTRIFTEFTGRTTTFSQLEYASKKATLENSLASEINALAHRLERLSEHNRHTRDFTLNGLLNALREVIACLPIYRTYITGGEGISERDEQFIEGAVADAKRRNPRTEETIFDHVRDTLLLRNLDAYDASARQDVLDFAMRFQQITPPVMAKSVEDTLFYVYNRLVSVNEVGGSPAQFGITPEQFAEENTKRCRLWPQAMLATSTHDTKRSEDVRARLNVLSEVPSEWEEALQTWSRINAGHKTMVNAGPAPSANDEYLLYQTLLGTYQDQDSTSEDYADRVVQYMAKATKEAKVSTSWMHVNEAYDQAVEGFVRAILQSEEFLEAFRPLQRRVAYFGQFNALSQTLLKLTCPGVPDTYRGTEVWDFSMVDPDNRRPVGYKRIRAQLKALQASAMQASVDDRAALADDLLTNSEDGRIKLYVIETALNFRRDHAELFIAAPYEPMAVEGEKVDHVCAFTREYEGAGVLVVVPRLIAGLTGGVEAPPIGEVWGETSLRLEEGYAGRKARNLLTGETITLDESVPLASLLRRFPVGLFELDANGV